MTYLGSILKTENSMRKIVGQYITRNGELKAIYGVQSSVMRPRDIIVGESYEIAYRLPYSVGYLNAKLKFYTDDYRTLFFENPTNPNRTIGIPIMSILKFYLK